MSAETLRRAAALMRERATNDLTPGPWEVRYQCPEGDHHHDWDEVWLSGEGGSTVAGFNERYTCAPRDAEHVASWQPAVALAVADLLSDLAIDYEDGAIDGTTHDSALAVACAYLGEQR